MQKIKFAIFLFIISGLFYGCKFGQPINPNALTESLTVENEEVGWKIEVPKGWEVANEDEGLAYLKKEIQRIDKRLNHEPNTDELIHLLKITRNETNTLAISAKPVYEEVLGEWELNNEIARKFLIAAYRFGDDTLANVSEPTTVNINGLDFITYSISYSKQGSDTVTKQNVYSAFYNGYDLSASITYLEDEMKDEMLAIWNSSQFEIRDIPDSIKAHNAEMESRYELYIINADKARDEVKYAEAMYWYEKAYDLNPLIDYALHQFATINVEMEEADYEILDNMKLYDRVINKANSLFNSLDYEAALEYYERATKMLPAEAYPKEKIKTIKQLLK